MELSRLEMGESNAFQHISENVDHQRALSHRYLGAEVHDAEGNRKLHLHRALQKVDREMPQINRALDKDYGLDY
ncbi:hypothetical protein [Lentilitoribacter sp. EG35]|uniref:hypothetical protein n=1 Tax=Lentilitoribacter sp. EG35 TaxID=3234192 RepID=UPI0034608F74